MAIRPLSSRSLVRSKMFDVYRDPGREILITIDPACDSDLVEDTIDIPAGDMGDPLDPGETFEPESCS